MSSITVGRSVVSQRRSPENGRPGITGLRIGQDEFATCSVCRSRVPKLKTVTMKGGRIG